MIGAIVPLVMIQRFTGYLGAGTYATVPLLVSDYSKATLDFWRGELAGNSGPTPATFAAAFEEADDPDPPGGAWSALHAAITSVNSLDLLTLEFTKRYFRIRIVLTADPNGVAGITCWAAGTLERRVAGGRAAD